MFGFLEAHASQHLGLSVRLSACLPVCLPVCLFQLARRDKSGGKFSATSLYSTECTQTMGTVESKAGILARE